MYDQLCHGGPMRQPYEVAMLLLDDMFKVNQAWHTREDQISSLKLRMSKGKIEKDYE